MKKFRRHKRNNLKIILFIIVIFLVAFIQTGYSYLVQQLKVNGVATIDSIIHVINDSSCNTQVTTDYSFWSSGNTKTHTYTFNLKNLSTKPMYYWHVSIPLPTDAVITATNAVYTITNNTLYLSGTDYNTYINGLATINFTITINTSIPYALRNISVYNCSFEPVVTNDVTLNVTFNQTGAWGNFRQYDVVVKNNSTIQVSAWEVKIGVPADLTLASSWSTNYVRVGNVITFTNLSYNGTLAPGASTTFGIQLKAKNNNFTTTLISALGSK